MTYSKKPFRTYQELLDILSSQKGMIVEDNEQAIDLLKRCGYFALVVGYKKPFKQKNGKYKPRTTLDDLYKLYVFDSDLRALFLKYILIIENHIKSLLSYAFCMKYGDDEKAYLFAPNYAYTERNAEGINKLIEKLSAALHSHDNRYPYIRHQKAKHNNVPLWVLMKAMSFGVVSSMYSFLPQSIQQGISREFAHVNEGMLVQMLDLLARVRNVCAHNERLFNYRYNKGSIDDMPAHKALCIPRGKMGVYQRGKRDLLAAILVLFYLLPKKDFIEFASSLDTMISCFLNEERIIQTLQLYKDMGLVENLSFCEERDRRKPT